LLIQRDFLKGEEQLQEQQRDRLRGEAAKDYSAGASMINF